MPNVPPSGGGAPTQSMPVARWCNLYKKVWREKLKLSAWHLKPLQAMLIDWSSPPECNLPFHSATKYPVGSTRSDWRAPQLWSII